MISEPEASQIMQTYQHDERSQRADEFETETSLDENMGYGCPDANGASEDVKSVTSPWNARRNLIAYWLIGLCNNFAYVIMLSAAHDILKEQEDDGPKNHTDILTTALPTNETPSDNNYVKCNPISTGAILLADILPTLIIKLTAPFYIHLFSYRLKVCVVLVSNLLSFLLVSFSQGVWMSILGVGFASVAGGLGEITFLSLSAFYDRNVVSTYSSGTGGAGIFGSLSYAGLTAVGLSPRMSVLIMVVIPFIMAVSYFLILVKPVVSEVTIVASPSMPNEDRVALLGEQGETKKKHVLTLKEKLLYTLPIMKYMIPLTLVYFAEYFINQGLHELLYYDHIWLGRPDQYRWYQVDYQLGVFISRSSVNVIQINKLWILPVLQIINMVLLLLQVFYRFIPNIWIILAIVLYEGLLGGAAYVNTFYKMSKEIPQEYREFSLGVATIGDALGIALAGAVAIPSHNHICSLHLKM